MMRIQTGKTKVMLLLSILIFSIAQANADITEVKSVDFGEIAIVSNASVQQLEMDYLGNINIDPAIRIIKRGSPGVYRASGFAGNVQLFISANILNSTMNPGTVSAEYPILTSLSVPASVFTLPNGTADIPVGGIVSTSGSNGLGYAEASYSANIQITINF